MRCRIGDSGGNFFEYLWILRGINPLRMRRFGNTNLNLVGSIKILLGDMIYRKIVGPVQ